MSAIPMLLLLAVVMIALPLGLALQGPDEDERRRRRIEREAIRQEMELHPVERSEYTPYRRERPGRINRHYTDPL
jgi:hypothetical protein